MFSWPCAGRFRTCVVYLALPCAEASDPSPNAATATATSSKKNVEIIVFLGREFVIESPCEADDYVRGWRGYPRITAFLRRQFKKVFDTVPGFAPLLEAA